MNKIQHRYNRIAGLYDILEAPMEYLFSKWRRELISETSGETLEVGIGTGKNIPFYPDNVDLTGIDFSPKMVEITNKKLRDHPRSNTRIIQMDAEEMEFEDNTFDNVVTSCVFCSVPDAVQGLKEIKRVCRDGGKVLMLEHVRSKRKITGKFMDIINPIPLYIYGANINRRTYENLLKAGFKPEQIEVKNIWLDIVKLIRINNTNKIQ
ncbi:MAG: methyltransferase domain-containing protein [Bacteroidales bacterium]